MRVVWGPCVWCDGGGRSARGPKFIHSYIHSFRLYTSIPGKGGKKEKGQRRTKPPADSFHLPSLFCFFFSVLHPLPSLPTTKRGRQQPTNSSFPRLRYYPTPLFYQTAASRFVCTFLCCVLSAWEVALAPPPPPHRIHRTTRRRLLARSLPLQWSFFFHCVGVCVSKCVCPCVCAGIRRKIGISDVTSMSLALTSSGTEPRICIVR